MSKLNWEKELKINRETGTALAKPKLESSGYFSGKLKVFTLSMTTKESHSAVVHVWSPQIHASFKRASSTLFSSSPESLLFFTFLFFLYLFPPTSNLRADDYPHLSLHPHCRTCFWNTNPEYVASYFIINQCLVCRGQHHPMITILIIRALLLRAFNQIDFIFKYSDKITS